MGGGEIQVGDHLRLEEHLVDFGTAVVGRARREVHEEGGQRGVYALDLLFEVHFQRAVDFEDAAEGAHGVDARCVGRGVEVVDGGWEVLELLFTC